MRTSARVRTAGGCTTYAQLDNVTQRKIEAARGGGEPFPGVVGSARTSRGGRKLPESRHMSGTEAEKAALRADGWRYGRPTAPQDRPSSRARGWPKTPSSRRRTLQPTQADKCARMASLLPTLCSRRWRPTTAPRCRRVAAARSPSCASRRRAADARRARTRSPPCCAAGGAPGGAGGEASGCAAIANLVLEEGEAAVLAAGAIGAVIKHWRRTQGGGGAGQGCLALGNIAGGDAGEAEAVRCGAVAAAFDARGATTPRWQKRPSMRSRTHGQPAGLAALAATDAPRDMLERVAAHGLADATALAGRWRNWCLILCLHKS